MIVLEYVHNFMRRKHIITISGKPGSGKSSTSDRVAEMLQYSRYSSGDLVRHTIDKKNMTLIEYNTQAKKDPALDHEVDEALRRLREKNDIVIDSRLGFYWIPESFKVYLWLDTEVAIARIYRDVNLNTLREKSDEGTHSMSEVSNEIEERSRNERERFKRLYGVDPFNTDNFDLVVDTSRHSPQTVALTVYDHYKKWLETDTWERVVSRVPTGYSFKNEY